MKIKALDYLYRMKEANEQVGQEPTNIIEAIKELEDLQNRSCKNCRFVGYFSLHESLECQNNDCNFYGNDVDIFTSCNKWEAK